MFVALLDKWEIGYPLSQAIAFDCLATLNADKGLGTDEDTVCHVSAPLERNAEICPGADPDHISGHL